MEVYTVKVNKSGTRFWYQNDVFHRTDGPAIECTDGYKSWWVEGKLHRTDGPAVEWAIGTKEWWVEGRRHRTDGPAVEDSDGYKSWYIEGKKLTEEEFNKLTQTHKDMPLTEREAAIWNKAVESGRMVKPIFTVTQVGRSTIQDVKYVWV